MFYEVLLLLSVSGIFVILARKYPQTATTSQRAVASQPEASPFIKNKRGLRPNPKLRSVKKIAESFTQKLSRVARALPKLIGGYIRIWRQRKKVDNGAKAQNATLQKPVSAPEAVAKVTITQADRLLLSGQVEKAEKIYLQLIKTRPRDGKIYSRIGIVYMKKGDYANAREAFEVALRENPKVGARYYNLALAYRALGDFSSAISKLRRALKLSPSPKYQALLKTLQKQSVSQRIGSKSK